MASATEKFFDSLTPEKLDNYLFRSPPGPGSLPTIFGGEMLARSLNAASRTVPEDRYVHSMHAYFLRSGDNHKPVVFYVDPLRDGGSFSTRYVVAKQDDKAIFNASLSFKMAEKGVEHQPEAPDFVDPLSIQNDTERRRAKGYSETYSERDMFSAFDFRTVGPLQEEYSKGDNPSQGIWVRTTAPVEDSLIVQQSFLAYLSDVRLMVAAMKPHGIPFFGPNVKCASLDHALWFHKPFKFDDWIYYEQVGPVGADSRGLNFGRFYDRSGQLIASTAQEGLMRVKNL